MTDIEVPAAPVAPVRTPLGVARGVLKTMRPRQWVKNILVFAAPFVGGDLLTPGITAASETPVVDPEDTLPRIVVGSVTARALYRVWSGQPVTVVDSPPGAGKS